MGIRDVSLRFVPALVVSACASAPIGDGFTAGDGVFSTTAMTATAATEGDTDVDPSQGSMTTTAGTTMSSTDATETDATDPTSDTDVDPSMTTTEDSGPTTDDPSVSSSGSGDDGPMPFCGDGVTDPGEACDDANQTDTDSCLAGCVAATCGDGVVWAGMEACDDGVNDGAYGGCNAGCGALAPFCGDASVQMQELCDPGVALPWQNVSCAGGTCIYDFSALPQLYCNGSCTWAGADSCDQADADIYCKLVTGDANSVATSFQVATALDAAGFACPGFGTNFGVLPAYGVNVWYQDTSILANHGGGSVIANATCS